MKQLSAVAGLCLAAAGLLGSGSAQALLVDRGSGMLYDTVLNVTWLQDANYAKTSGFDADGKLTRDAGGGSAPFGTPPGNVAMAWADNLVYGGYSDWRLPRHSPVSGSTYTFLPYSFDGSTDSGWNIPSSFSELSHMYYVNLGLKGQYSPDGSSRSDYGIFGNGTPNGQNDVGLVKNLQSWPYWSFSSSGAPTVFSFGGGSQVDPFTWLSVGEHPGFFAWAVRDGDVTVVPVPGSVALLVGGLALLGVMTRRRGRLAVDKS
ncbi:MAG: hypothetical protein WCJ87_08120 [Burkholderiales bacterium]